MQDSPSYSESEQRAREKLQMIDTLKTPIIEMGVTWQDAKS